MSGGSYNYLCHASADELMNKVSDLNDMVDRLSGLGYAEDAARETLELLLTVRQFETRLTVMTDRLSNVWRAVEWLDSCDSDESSVKNALDDYRGKDNE